ncbi:hypothetical protein E8A74_50240 [Polyangium fumosum]|uniref:Uncharacterized protein n=1 Tax=Polyangium fumosum TaxID=889272 RepID=A0A4U1IGQ6_9BACT|nr:hypothetical protein E8A74_50240 [Polyangium fumosum]
MARLITGWTISSSRTRRTERRSGSRSRGPRPIRTAWARPRARRSMRCGATCCASRRTCGRTSLRRRRSRRGCWRRSRRGRVSGRRIGEALRRRRLHGGRRRMRWLSRARKRSSWHGSQREGAARGQRLGATAGDETHAQAVR